MKPWPQGDSYIDKASLAKIEDVLSRILILPSPVQYDPELHQYCGALVKPHELRKYLKHKIDIFRLGRQQIRDAVILDAGCGFGITSVLFALLGAKEVHGLDVTPSRLDTFKAYLTHLDSALPVFPALRDVCDSQLPDGHCDIVFSNEALSHYRDVPRFFQEAHRLLKKGGALLISDANNGENPAIAKDIRAHWKRYEEGPATLPQGGKTITPFVTMRREIIRQAFPHFSEDEQIALSQGTSGLNKMEILAACEEYVKTHTLPRHFYTGEDSPLHPINDAVVERLFRPLHLAQQMHAHRFTATAYAYFGGAGDNPGVRLANKILRWLTPLSIRFAHGFQIVAIKD